MQSALTYAEDVINTVREPLLVLDDDLVVISANKSFYKTFDLKKSVTEGRSYMKLEMVSGIFHHFENS